MTTIKDYIQKKEKYVFIYFTYALPHVDPPYQKSHKKEEKVSNIHIAIGQKKKTPIKIKNHFKNIEKLSVCIQKKKRDQPLSSLNP